MQQIIFINNSGSLKDYGKHIAKKIPNSIYLNIDHLYQTFGKTLASELTDQFTYDERIKIPSHQTILGYATDNIKIGNIAIIDGPYDANLMKELLIGKNIEAHFIDFVNLEKKESTPPAKNHLEIDTTKNIEDNHKQISEFLIHLPLSSPTSTDSFVIVPNGLGGVGKTTVLTKVAEETHAVVVDTDNPTLNYLMGKFPVASDYYGKYIKANRYQCSFDILQENLELGKSGIIDGFLGDRLNTPPVEKLKGIPNIKFLITQFHCSLEVQEENLRERGAARDEEKLKGNNLSRDRQSTVTRLIPNLVDSRNTLQISTENHDDLKKNVEIIKSHLSSPNFKSSTLAPRSIPLDPKLLNISTEQVKGDLDSLNLLVNEIRFEDNINKIAAESKAAPIPNLTGLKHHGLFKRSESAHNLPALKPKKSFLKY